MLWKTNSIQAILLRYAFLFLAAALTATIVAGCKDNISTLGAQYFTDTVGIHTTVRNDTGFFHFTDSIHPAVSFNGVSVALTDSTPAMIIGRVASGNDNLESWGLIQFPSLTDSLAHMVTGIQLVLKDERSEYGDTTNSNVSFRVWTTYKTVFDSTTQLSQSQLSASPVGSIDTVFPDDSDAALPIMLDTALVKPVLTEAFNAFVITPGLTMTNTRKFGTIHNWADSNSIPKLALLLNNGDTLYEKPTLDFHLVHDMSITPVGEFSLRGSTGQREKITFNLASPTDSAHLDQFTSINDATLLLHFDPAYRTHSNKAGDVLAPFLVKLGTTDVTDTLETIGVIDTAHSTCSFQIRNLVEQWLRYPSQNLGLELRVDFAQRNFAATTSSPQLIGVEDNTINRWTFYGPNYSDSTKRPSLILSYSKLH